MVDPELYFWNPRIWDIKSRVKNYGGEKPIVEVLVMKRAMALHFEGQYTSGGAGYS